MSVRPCSIAVRILSQMPCISVLIQSAAPSEMSQTGMSPGIIGLSFRYQLSKRFVPVVLLISRDSRTT